MTGQHDHFRREPIPPGAIPTADRHEGPRADVASGATPACRHVRVPANADNGSDGNALCDAWRQCAAREMVRPECGPKKPAASFPARARDENCDAELMPVICPTAQEYFL